MAKDYVNCLLGSTERRGEEARRLARLQARRDELEAVKKWAGHDGGANVQLALAMVSNPIPKTASTPLGKNFVKILSVHPDGSLVGGLPIPPTTPIRYDDRGMLT